METLELKNTRPEWENSQRQSTSDLIKQNKESMNSSFEIIRETKKKEKVQTD